MEGGQIRLEYFFLKCSVHFGRGREGSSHSCRYFVFCFLFFCEHHLRSEEFPECGGWRDLLTGTLGTVLGVESQVPVLRLGARSPRGY